jgi:hypothetical protein
MVEFTTPALFSQFFSRLFLERSQKRNRFDDEYLEKGLTPFVFDGGEGEMRLKGADLNCCAFLGQSGTNRQKNFQKGTRLGEIIPSMPCNRVDSNQ